MIFTGNIISSQIFKGTVIAKVRLAYNASEEVANKVKTKLVKIENSAEVELEKRRKSG
jgi:hypothetical protein